MAYTSYAAANNLAYGRQASLGMMGIQPGGSPIDQLLSQARKAQEEGKKANEDRYAEILKGYQTREQQGLDLLRGAGTQEEKDIRTQYASLGNAQMQNLAARGLGGTTVMPTMQAGIARQETDAIGRLRERLNQQLYGATTGLSGDRLRFMEARTDTYPSLSEIAGLAQNYGQGTGGGGGYAIPVQRRMNIRERAPVTQPTNKGDAQILRELAAGKKETTGIPIPGTWSGAPVGEPGVDPLYAQPDARKDAGYVYPGSPWDLRRYT